MAERLDSIARFAGFGSYWVVIPGLRSLCSLTRGYYLPRLTALVESGLPSCDSPVDRLD
jgi:hypothetical protein